MRSGETPNHLKHGWQQSRHGSLQNRLGPISQQSGRVGRGSYARFKAEIELHNIRTKAKHESHPSGANFEFLCLAVRTSPPRHSRTPERELHPVTQRANHSEGAKNSPSRSQLLVRWQDHAHRVRKGSITLYTRSRHSPRCPDEFSTDFNCLRIVFHRFQLFWHGFSPFSRCGEAISICFKV